MRQCSSLINFELVISLVIKTVDVFLPHELKNALNGRKGGKYTAVGLWSGVNTAWAECFDIFKVGAGHVHIT